MSLRIVPVSFADACAFVREHHRHHADPVGHKFSVGVADGAQLVGVAMLYGACGRVTFALGYDRLITYTRDGESGASLRAAGYRVIASRPARKGWDTPSRPRDQKGSENVARTLWEAVA